MKVELVTTLKRRAAKILSELRRSNEPVLITEHGRPAAYLVSTEDYELMQRRIEILAGISRGERAILDKNTFTNTQARKKMKKWLA